MTEAKKISRFKKDVLLHLPPEYQLPIGEWERLFKDFAEEGFMGLGVASLLQMDMKELWKNLDFDQEHAEISNIRSTPEGFLVDITFDTTKTGVAMLYVVETTKDIGFIPVVTTQGTQAIQRVSMTHLPS